MSHNCHALECVKPVPPRMLMCAKHWYMVPKAIQTLVWRHYVPGQEIRKDPTIEYLEVQRQAVVAVARKERKPVPAFMLEEIAKE